MRYEVFQQAKLQQFGGIARIVDPSETLEDLRVVSPKAGITRVANITGLDSVGVPVWQAIRPLSRSISVYQGKGVTHVNAQVSAIMEAVEFFHAEHLLPDGIELSLAESQSDSHFVRLEDLPVRPGADVHAHTVVTWIAGQCINSGNLVWYPKQVVDFNTLNRYPNSNCFASSWTGLASGNSLSEAVLHALCEVIERDCTVFWLVDQQLNPFTENLRVDPETVDDSLCRDLLERIGSAGLECAIWSLHNTMALPCYFCSIFDRRRETRYPSRSSGAGCHPYKGIALCRALSEALQSRLTFIAGARDDVSWSHYEEHFAIGSFQNRLWISEHADTPPAIDFRETTDFVQDQFLETILKKLVSALKESGFETIVVTDLFCDQLGVPVVHVFIPGMEDSLPQREYTPGRRMQTHLEELQQI